MIDLFYPISLTSLNMSMNLKNQLAQSVQFSLQLKKEIVRLSWRIIN